MDGSDWSRRELAKVLALSLGLGAFSRPAFAAIPAHSPARRTRAGTVVVIGGGLTGLAAACMARRCT